MKLYSTITSERSTKSQGGNEELKIEIFAGNKSREKLGVIEVYVYDKNPESVVVKWISHKWFSSPTLHNEILPD